ncbi:MAG: ATP-dependent helicase [Rubrivivax sp.]
MHDATLAPPLPRRHAASGLDVFAQLNDEQRLAVFHGSEAPPHAAPALLVIAGAGSGKTLTLASRVARLVLQGADPQRLLLMTFSRRAARDLQRRVGQVLHRALGFGASQQPPQLSWVGTFHSVAARLLQQHAAQVGLAENFSVLDRSDSEDLIGLLRHDQGLSTSQRRFATKGTCLAIHSRCLNSRAPLDEVLREHFPWCADSEEPLRELFRAYAAHKQQQHLLDYDDLLLYWSAMMQDEAMAKVLGERFQHVLVDEYQDTNRLQAHILQALKPTGHGLSVVGDDAQSIYSFRAAQVRNILDFPRQFEPPAAVLSLQRNYRSTAPILHACNAVIAEAAEQFAKSLWTVASAAERPQLVYTLDEAEQAVWAADQVLARREGGLALKRQAVLFRTSHHSAALELELLRRDIPYVKFGGLKFLEAAHVKDLLSVLRWAHNPRHRMAGFRVAQLVAGMGPASAQRLIDATAHADDPAAVWQAFKPPSSANGWLALRDCLFAMQNPGATWPAPLQCALLWYRGQLARLHEHVAPRESDLAQLAQMALQFTSIEQFLAELTLDPPQASSDEAGEPHLDDDYLVLSTIHSAKGQEWAAVTVLNVVDGCMPSDMATGTVAGIEEERRLLYVAMTRAQHHLQLMVPHRFYVTQQGARGDRHLYGSISRFITPAVAACFDTVSAAQEPAGMELRADITPLRIDIHAAVRSLWD